MLGLSFEADDMPSIFTKFNPRAFQECANFPGAVEAERSPTLAALATLAAPTPPSAIREVGQSATTIDHRRNGENQKFASAPAKVAKLAKAEPSVTTLEQTPWGETEEERAAIIEYDGGAPRAWAEALARLDPAKPPIDIPPERWVRFIDDFGRFLDAWVHYALALGWSPLDLFGCDRERPWERIDHQGLLWLINGNSLVALSTETAIIETPPNGRQTYRRRTLEPGCVVLAWELQR
jgi:hypothetical protein